MIPSLFTLPLKWLPKPLTAVSLGITLNLFFDRHPDHQDRLKELSGKLFLFDVEDLGQQFFMMVDENGRITIHTESNNSIPNVTMAGNSNAFLALLMNTVDPDSLFFSRQLKLSGETDVGLCFKNILDSLEVDWAEELSNLVGGPITKILLAMAGQVTFVKDFGKGHLEEGADEFINYQNAPPKSEWEELDEGTQDLVEREDKIAKSIARIIKKRQLAAAKPDTDKKTKSSTAKKTGSAKATSKKSE